MKLLSENAISNVHLRPLLTSDAEPLAVLANNKKVWDNLRDKMPHPYNVEDAKNFIKMTQEEEQSRTFAIVFDNELCGVIGLLPQNDVSRHNAELGYWLGEPFWGRGIATAAVKIITRYAFQKLELMRIEAGAYEYNKGSMRVLEKCGFEKEGIARKSVYKNGAFFDTHNFARLRSD